VVIGHRDATGVNNKARPRTQFGVLCKIGITICSFSHNPDDCLLGVFDVVNGTTGGGGSGFTVAVGWLTSGVEVAAGLLQADSKNTGTRTAIAKK